MGTSSRTYNYVSESGGKNVLKYKYSGSDASLLYNHIISPTAQWIVNNVLPEWLAPNVITVFGLSLVASSHIALAYYCSDFTGEAPRWVYGWSGFALLIYQILDVADGKQARKTGNASPLGLLFDHGCDALNCVLSACNMAAVTQMGPSYLSMGILICPSLVFFMATFEEFYTGTLALPGFNGPNEGLLIMYSIYFYCCVFGSAFWVQPSLFFPSLPNNLVFLLATAFASVLTVVSNGQNVLAALRREQKSKYTALVGLLPYLCIVVLTGTWVFLSPTDVVAAHPRLVIWTSGLLFCKLVMHMMLAHLCDEPFNLLRKTLVIMFTVAFLFVAGFVPYSKEYDVAKCLFGLTLLVYIHMVYYVIMELTSILGIRCFVVKSKNK